MVQSKTLPREILLDKMESQTVRARARKAAEWGSGAAEGWASDTGYIRYLTLLILNRPSGWGL